MRLPQETADKHRKNWLSAFLAWALSLAAFGPYISQGIRTDNAATWLLLPVGAWSLLNVRLTGRAWLVIASWMTLFATAVLSYVAPALNTSPYPLGDVAAGIDIWVGPMIALSVGILLVGRLGSQRLFYIVSLVLTLGMTGNVLLALAQWGSPTASRVIGQLWGLSVENSTLARAATLGRHSGIMQQPALAGAMYGLALIVATHMFAGKPILRDSVWAVLLIGGTLSASKAFWFVGLPVALILRIGMARKGHSSDGWKSAMAFVPIVGLLALLDVSFGDMVEAISAALDKLWSAAMSGIPGITGNRFGDESVLVHLVTYLINDAPLAGYGIGGLATSVDSGFVQALIAAGLIGLICMVLVCWIILGTVWADRRAADGLGPVGLALAVAITALTFGFPVLTGNRSTLIVWLLVAVMLMRSPQRRQLNPAPRMEGRFVSK